MMYQSVRAQARALGLAGIFCLGGPRLANWSRTGKPEIPVILDYWWVKLKWAQIRG
jgi:hypothetical protein